MAHILSASFPWQELIFLLIFLGVGIFQHVIGKIRDRQAVEDLEKEQLDQEAIREAIGHRQKKGKVSKGDPQVEGAPASKWSTQEQPQTRSSNHPFEHFKQVLEEVKRARSKPPVPAFGGERARQESSPRRVEQRPRSSVPAPESTHSLPPAPPVPSVDIWEQARQASNVGGGTANAGLSGAFQRERRVTRKLRQHSLSQKLHKKQALREAIILSEILQAPLSLRPKVAQGPEPFSLQNPPSYSS